MQIPKKVLLLLLIVLVNGKLAAQFNELNLIKNSSFEDLGKEWIISDGNFIRDSINQNTSLQLPENANASQKIQIVSPGLYVFTIIGKSTKRKCNVDFVVSTQIKNHNKVILRQRFFLIEEWTKSSISLQLKDTVVIRISNSDSKDIIIGEVELLQVAQRRGIEFCNVEEETESLDYFLKKVQIKPNNQKVGLQTTNLLLNDGFEEGLTIWNIWGAEVSLGENGYQSKNCASIESAQAKWIGFNKLVNIPSSINTISLKALVKTIAVKQGKESYEKFVFKAVFQDEAGSVLQESPVVELIGTKDWKLYYKSIKVPSKATKVDIVLALGNCTGQVFIDNIEVGDFDMDLSDQPTVLINGDFEEGLDSWSAWGAQSTLADSNKCILIKNTDFVWSGCHQELSINKNLKYILLSGKFRLKDVVGGSNGWEKAVCKLEFLDKTGNLLNEQYLLSAVGTSKWIDISKTFKVPDNGKLLRLTIALGNSKGEFWADKIELTEGNEDQYVLERAKLLNPGFEEGLAGWPDYAGVITGISHTGNNAVMVSNTTQKRDWLMRRQTIIIPNGAKNFKISAWVKLDKAEKMANGWEGARIYVSYLDKSGIAIPQTDAGVFRGDGTTDWVKVSQELMIPGNAYELTVNIALCNSFGNILVDDIDLEFESEATLYSNIKTGWYPMKFNNNLYSGHYVDWSVLLDAPAGKHGFLKVKNGQHTFEDGTPGRFFGVNIGAEFCFLTKAKVDSLVRRFSKVGINLVRMHHMDAGWAVRNLFGPGDGKTTRKLDPIRLEQFDYLVASLKKAGIYIYLDILVHRQFKPGDGIANTPMENGGKQVAIFDEKIIELQKEFIDQLFSHVNLYTGLTYGNDPVFIGSEIVNETWIGGQWSGEYLTKPYADALDQKFKLSPYYKGRERARFKHVSKELQAFAFLEPVNKDSDPENTLKFLHDQEAKYVKELLTHIQSKNVKYPLAYTNFPFSFTSLLKNKAIGDIIINNTYWAHPWDFSIGVKSPLVKASMLQKINKSLIVENSSYVINRKPFMITEWNHCYPNPHRAEALPMMAAYGVFQDWDMTQFVWSDDPLGASSINSFSIAQDPVSIAQWVVAAPLFHRGYVQRAKGRYVHSISEDKLFSLPNQDRFIIDNYYIPYVTKYSNSFELKKDSGDIDIIKKSVNIKSNTFISDTEELKIDGTKNMFSISTDRIQGAVGFYKGENIKLPILNISLKNEFASAFLVSQDSLPLLTSKRMFLVVVTNVEMKGQEWDENIPDTWKKDGNGQLKVAGKFPLIAEYAIGSITLNRKFDTTKTSIYELSPDGVRTKKIPFELSDSNSKINFTNIESFVLEIVIE